MAKAANAEVIAKRAWELSASASNVQSKAAAAVTVCADATAAEQQKVTALDQVALARKKLSDALKNFDAAFTATDVLDKEA